MPTTPTASCVVASVVGHFDDESDVVVAAAASSSKSAGFKDRSEWVLVASSSPLLVTDRQTTAVLTALQ
jgi:hypothetical protein